MAVLLAAALLTSALLTPQKLAQSEAYDNADIESPVETSTEAEPSESLEIGPRIDVRPSDPHAYLYASYPRVARRLDCVIGHESRWQPGAYNPRSGAAGVAQFLYGTWLSTPQGKAGASRYDPFASIDGAVYLIEKTPQSWRHWAVISLC